MESSLKYRLTRMLERYAVNPVMRTALTFNMAPTAFALVATTGRRTSRRRLTPVGNGLQGDVFWLVAEHGLRCDYMKNLVAHPEIDVKAGGRWRHGTATIVPGDDAVARRRRLDKANGLVGRVDGRIFMTTATDPLTVRVDLVPSQIAESQSPDGFHVRASAFLPARVRYVDQVISQLGGKPTGSCVLVVGSGRGLLARDLARRGFAVTALDPDSAAVLLAKEASADWSGHYEVGAAEALPFGDASFDVAYYQDTFETTDDLETVLKEAARVLRRGGVLLYDTVNRTTLSRLIYLGALQSWRWTRIMPNNRYTRERLRPPAELAATMSAYGLRSRDVSALVPAGTVRLIRSIRRARRGEIDDAGLAALAGMHVVRGSEHPKVTYLGFAIKDGNEVTAASTSSSSRTSDPTGRHGQQQPTSDHLG
jgi:2-polyprenyl-6-hydroxyphenyl methylase / 3-demethylubiquinone-9 3-methyltransferase